jgi:hypothetical protein
MRSLLLATLLLGAPGAALPAPTGPASAPTKPVTLHLRATPFRQAVAALFQGTGQTLQVRPDIAGTSVTLDLQNVEFQTALRRLLDAAGAAYRLETPDRAGRTIWVFFRRPPRPRATAAPVPTAQPAATPAAAASPFIEMVVPAAANREVMITAEQMSSSGTTGAIETRGNVTIRLPNGVLLQVHGAHVQSVTRGTDGARRFVITPLAASAPGK